MKVSDSKNMKKSQAGKGSRRRKMSVRYSEWDKRYALAFGKKSKN